jgi:hypothetical protein
MEMDQNVPEEICRDSLRCIYRRALKEKKMLLVVLLLVLLLAVVPAWPHSRRWGYRPSGVLGAVLLVVIVLALMGRI